MESMGVYMYTESNAFIPLEQAKKKIISETNKDVFNRLFSNKYLFLSVKENGVEYIYRKDIPFYIRLAKTNLIITENDYEKFGSAYNLLSSFFKISDNTAVFAMDDLIYCGIPAFLRNLLYYPVFENYDNRIEINSERFEVMGITVITYETQIKEYMRNVIKRKKETDHVLKSNFASTASYMGNKRKIAGFLIEAIIPHATDKCTFIDLMCGSGAMSRAFAQLSNTYASDAQEFCLYLARIQGHGLTKSNSQKILDRISYHYKINYDYLKNIYEKSLDEEAMVYLQNWSNKSDVYLSYQKCVERFPLYSSTEKTPQNIEEIIERHKKNTKEFPYCLFTLYFTNVFFGLHQCIQLDSIRYAIDNLKKEDRIWALGALVITAYQISSGHASHFAQPKKVTEKNIDKILIKRNKSAYHEFCKRLLCLAEESELTANEIHILSGPWKNALTYAKDNVLGKKLIYLDAPYKRDEYSRYYHVLETLVKYDYPSSELNGHMRSKKLKERFATEFFTKSAKAVEKIFVDIITEIIKSDMKCAWSYSDNGDASIINVINGVHEQTNCNISLYGIPHNHHSQRALEHSIHVTEYCIIFSPK